MVKELIKKDIIFLLSSLKSTVAIIICFSLFMSMINKAYGMVTPALACYIGFYSLMAYEERNKMDLVEFALPVSRQEICLSKYIEIVLFIIFSCICSTVGSLINDVILYPKSCCVISFLNKSLFAFTMQ